MGSFGVCLPGSLPNWQRVMCFGKALWVASQGGMLMLVMGMVRRDPGRGSSTDLVDFMRDVRTGLLEPGD